MEKLVSSSEAAKILGISLQGVHYRIKQGKLKAHKKDGKFFVYLDTNNKNKEDSVLVIKDEQILLLKKTIKWMRAQYKNEIKRLEKNQNKIIEVFKSEINLLQSAFNEMKNVYKIGNKNPTKSTQKVDFNLMDIKDFFIFMKQNNKSDLEIKSIILDRIKQGDNRFIYNKQTKEVMIYKSDFIDLI